MVKDIKYNKHISFSVPVHWNKDILRKIRLIKIKAEESINKKINVTMYGCLPEDPFGRGRIPNTPYSVSTNDAKEYIQQAHNFGFRFRYLFNSKKNILKSDINKIFHALDKVIEDFKVDELTITQKELLDLVQEKYPSTSVIISTIAGVKTPEQIKEYSKYKIVKSICLHHDTNRNIPNLRECINEANKVGISLELMLTECCLDNCQEREAHYSFLGKQANPNEKIDKYQIPCWIKKIKNPKEVIKASWITPEGLNFYESLGIKRFKITGRDKNKERLPRILEAYFNKRFNGNIARLLGSSPQLIIKKPIEPEDILFIDANAMQRFYEKLDAALSKGFSYEKYCSEITESLFREGHLKILDPNSKYDIVNGKVTAKKTGIYYQKMIEEVFK